MFKIILSLALFASVSLASKSHFTLYNRADSSEATYWATYRRTAPGLANLYFDAPEWSKCFSGIWLIHNVKDYGFGIWHLASESEVCESFSTLQPFNSLRPVGDVDDITRSSLTFYESTANTGPEHVFFEDVPSFANVSAIFRSAALTGPEPVTIFQIENFQGLSVCIQPLAFQNLVTFVNDIETELGVDPMEIRSIKFGCF